MLKTGDYHIIISKNDNMGYIYSSNTGKIVKTSISNASKIKSMLRSYYSDCLGDDERIQLESFLNKLFYSFRNISIVDEKRLFDRKELKKIELIIANDCNLRCKYCYEDGGSFNLPRSIMEPNQAKEYLQAIFDLGYNSVKNIFFFGGEPLLAIKTIEVVCEYIESLVNENKIIQMPDFMIITNGTLITEEVLKLFEKYNFKITISLDGPEVINDKLRIYRNGAGTFDKIEKSIELLEKSNINYSFEATYTELHNKLGFTKRSLYEYLFEKFNPLDVLIANCSGNTVYSYEDLDNEEYLNYDFLLPNYELTYKQLNASEISNCGCNVAYGSFAIQPNGDVYPCHFFVQDPNFRIGTYSNGAFDFSTYNLVIEKFDLIKKDINLNCITCWARNICSPCPAQHLLYNNEINATCKTIRLQQERLILKCINVNNANK